MMYKNLLFVVIFSFSSRAFSQTKIARDTILLQPVEVTAIRAGDHAPFSKTNLSQQELAKNNFGQDLPFILNQTPSVVVNSDAGNGVGYTGIRIRGTDGTRINVTLNGIPYNDAESQISYFVDLPDIASSVNSLQVQRGVGTSSNGAGAFGATINLSTNEVNAHSYLEANNTIGSFNTWKNTLKLGSGVLGKHFTLDARLSRISSDGYVERAASKLQSGYFSAAWLTEKSSVRFNLLTGKEKTYQSWNGIPEAFLTTNRRYNSAGTEKPGDPYPNETDNYTQSHYQLFFNHKISTNLSYNLAAFFTKGQGYYEEYRSAQAYTDYGLPDFTDGQNVITETDLVKQLWLNNNFYGAIFSVQQKNDKTQFTAGGGCTKYDGKHYGIVTWAPQGVPGNYKYYSHDAHKTDLNLYTKLQHQLTPKLSAFGDVQLRLSRYIINGFEDHPDLLVKNNYVFVNPKAGFNYLDHFYNVYLSYSLTSKEPNRDDFEAGISQPPHAEVLHDVELGAERKTTKYSYGFTGYYMYYHNQLVLTGKINDVGSYTRTNTPSSSRLGIELQARAFIYSWLTASGNFTLSRNKIRDFTSFDDDYDSGGQKSARYHNTDISFSPAKTGSASFNFIPKKNTEVSFISKYVGKQFLDNTSQDSRSLHGYFVEDVRASYTLALKGKRQVVFAFQVNNIFNRLYEPNGYTYSYVSGGSYNTENYYFPMAGTNFLAAINIKL